MIRTTYDYQNSLLEIYEIGGDDSGWIIRFLANGKVNLFEVGNFDNGERFEGEFNTIYKALEVCTKWT